MISHQDFSRNQNAKILLWILKILRRFFTTGTNSNLKSIIFRRIIVRRTWKNSLREEMILRIPLKIQLQISILDTFLWVTECLPPTSGKYWRDSPDFALVTVGLPFARSILNSGRNNASANGFRYSDTISTR